MLPLLAVVIAGVPSLIWWIVGLVLAYCIVLLIMRQVGAPSMAFTALYVIAGVVALILAISFFFGGTDGPILVK